MAILDIFKKKDDKEKQKPEKKAAPLKVEKKEEEKREKVAEIKKEEVKKSDMRENNIVYRVLKSSHVTEKAINQGTENKYVFRIHKSANKVETKKAIQDFYGVRVLGVNIVNIPKKKRRLGKTEGFRSGYKKAIVTLAKGDKIETGV